MENIGDLIYNVISSHKFYVPVLTICLAILIIKSSERLVKRIVNKDSKSLETKRKNTIVHLVQNIIKYVIIILAIIIILSVLGVNVTGLIAGLGVFGVVAGLAIQDALKDIIMGCNIIMDNYYVVGDTVTYNGFTGEIIEFGLKSTKIKNVDGRVLIVANRNISEIQNISQKSATVTITVPTAYKEKEEKVERVLKGVCEIVDTWDLSTKQTEYLGIDSLSSSSVDYLIRAHCVSGNQYELKRKILGLVKKEFDKNKIEIPFTQIEVHNG